MLAICFWIRVEATVCVTHAQLDLPRRITGFARLQLTDLGDDPYLSQVRRENFSCSNRGGFRRFDLQFRA